MSERDPRRGDVYRDSHGLTTKEVVDLSRDGDVLALVNDDKGLRLVDHPKQDWRKWAANATVVRRGTE